MSCELLDFKMAHGMHDSCDSPYSTAMLSLLLQEFVGKTNLWIGLSDASAEGEFEWSDGRSLADTKFTQWAPNQPDGFTEIPNEVMGQAILCFFVCLTCF